MAATSTQPENAMGSMKRERRLHLLALAFLAGLFIGVNASFLSSAPEPAHRYLDYFHRVYQIIVTEYVDETSPKEMFFGAIKGMIDSLDDPYSRFLDEKSLGELREMTTGKFQGVGVEITVQDGRVVVVAPIEDSPAIRAGIAPGDVITHIDDKAIKGKSVEEIASMIRGLPKSTVRLQISREGFAEPIEFTLERAPVKIASVEYGIIEKGSIGYLRIKNFGSDTGRDAAKAMKYFSKQGVKKAIIDVRNNPGGLLTGAVEVSELVLDRGRTIVSTRGREGSGIVEEYKSRSEPVYRGALAVLVNNGTASAAEILAGAVRDNERGVLLGEKTFGKGSVQKSFNLEDDIGVSITVARYYTPSGELIHKKGITPERVVPSERFSEDDMKGLKAIREKNLMDAFVAKDTVYDGASRSAFRAFLAEKGVRLSGRTADFVLKDWINRAKKKPLYDLEFDTQLSEAVRHLGGI